MEILDIHLYYRFSTKKSIFFSDVARWVIIVDSEDGCELFHVTREDMRSQKSSSL